MLHIHVLEASPQGAYFKGTHTVCFSISFHNVNQKRLSPRTNFHFETTRSVCSSERNWAMYLRFM